MLRNFDMSIDSSLAFLYHVLLFVCLLWGGFDKLRGFIKGRESEEEDNGKMDRGRAREKETIGKRWHANSH